MRLPALSPLPRRWLSFGLLALLVVLLVMLPGAGVVAQETPTSVVLIKNNGQADGTGLWGFNRDRGQGFTTGSHSAGYTLTSVQIGVHTGGSPTGYSVKIASDGGSGPGSTTEGTLTNPSSLSTGLNSFTGSVTLEPETTYYVFLDLTSPNTVVMLRLTASNDEDAGGAAGWSIEDASYRRGVSGTTWTKDTGDKMKIVINGYENPLPAPASATIDGGSLVIDFDKDLDTTSNTAAAQFGIKVDGGTLQNATAIAISGRQVTLTVPAVAAGRSVTVSYAKPSSDPLKDSAGGEVATFSDFAARNITPSPLVTPSAKLVGNTNQSFALAGFVIHERAQSFTTGSRGSGYTLTGVTFPFPTNQDALPDSLQVSVHSSGSDGKPGESLVSLTLAKSGAGNNAWVFATTSTGIHLEANTTYFVVMTGSSTAYRYRLTSSDSEDGGAAAGWSIGDKSLTGSPEWNTEDDSAWLIEVRGYANPATFESASVSLLGSNPVIVNFTGNIYGANFKYPDVRAWTVKVDGVSYHPYSVGPERAGDGDHNGGTSMKLWLSDSNPLFDHPLDRPRTATVSYDKTRAISEGSTGQGRLYSNGAQVASFFDKPVTIHGLLPPPPPPPPDTTAPTFSLASGHKSQVDIEWSEVLAYGSTVPSSAFTLTATKEDGLVQTIRGKADPVRYGFYYANFTVWMEEPVPSDAVLTLSYAKPADGQDQFRDRAGHVLESFSGKPVMNGQPRVQAVEIVSDPGEDETYGLGDTVRLRVRFDVPVRVNTSGGVPRMHVLMDSDYYMVDDGNGNIEYRYGFAHYVGGSGTDTLSFALRVAANNYGDGISLRRNALTTYYGGKIQSRWPWGFTQNADLSHAAVPHHPGHRVNGSVSLPKFQRASVAGNVLTLTFDRYLDTDPAPAPGDFHVTVDGAARRVSGVTLSGRTVRLTLASAVNLGQAVRVGYTRGANPLQDTSAREVESFADKTVSNNWAATLTVSDIGSGHRGCGLLATTSCESALTSHTFTKGSTSYEVERVSRGASDDGQVLVFALNQAIPSDWTLHVGDRTFPVADATLSDSDRTATWTSPGFSWSVGQTVALRLTAGPPGASGPRSESPGSAATVTDVAIVSDPGADDTYGDGDTIRVRVAFSKPVDVDTSGGAPRIVIDMDPEDWGEKWAAYVGGSGTTMLEFAHTVTEPNLSTGGIKVVGDSLEPNGGGVRNAGTDVAAVLSHGERPHNPDHKVDWRIASDTQDSIGNGNDGGDGGPPTVSGVEIVSNAGADDTYGDQDEIRIRVTFDAGGGRGHGGRQAQAQDQDGPELRREVGGLPERQRHDDAGVRLHGRGAQHLHRGHQGGGRLAGAERRRHRLGGHGHRRRPVPRRRGPRLRAQGRLARGERHGRRRRQRNQRRARPNGQQRRHRERPRQRRHLPPERRGPHPGHLQRGGGRERRPPHQDQVGPELRGVLGGLRGRYRHHGADLHPHRGPAQLLVPGRQGGGGLAGTERRRHRVGGLGHRRRPVPRRTGPRPGAQGRLAAPGGGRLGPRRGRHLRRRRRDPHPRHLQPGRGRGHRGRQAQAQDQDGPELRREMGRLRRRQRHGDAGVHLHGEGAEHLHPGHQRGGRRDRPQRGHDQVHGHTDRRPPPPRRPPPRPRAQGGLERGERHGRRPGLLTRGSAQTTAEGSTSFPTIFRSVSNASRGSRACRGRT